MRAPATPSRFCPRRLLLGLALGFALTLTLTLLAPTSAEAQCRGPGEACGILGGSCCSGATCILAVCVSTPSCQGEGGLCTSSSQCCGSRVCALGFCTTQRSLGEACGPGAPCQSGLVCDPLAGFVCVDQTADLGDACGPLVQCDSGLVCDPLAGFRCVDQTADLGDACGPLVQCDDGLVCDPLAGFVCVNQTAGLGDACGPLVQCGGGLVCDPLAGFRCVDDTAVLGQACGPLVQCASGLVCDPLAGFVCVDQNTDIGNACGPLVQCAEGGVCDPLAGFVCVPETTPTVGQACGPLFPCADGLFCDPLEGFVCVDQTAGEGAPCGPLAQCNDGLFCDPLAGFRCVTAAGVDEPCGPGVPCDDGLQCSLALRCSNVPARAGETCDATAPCGDGLFCQPGIPQRCREYRKPGEGCSAVNPCVAGASCEICFTEGCNAPLQCFYNSNEGAISEQTCRALYSPGIASSVEGSSLTKTIAAGNGIGAIASESQAFGVAYGQDGRYGCFTAFCGGIFTDVSIEAAFLSVGFYDDFDAVGGMSFVNLQSAQTPFNLLSYTASQSFERFSDDFPPVTGELIGTEAAFGVGGGLNPSPFTAGSFYCETVLDTVIEPAMGDAPVTLAVPPPVVGNNGFTEGLDGWSCVGCEGCALSDDDALGSGLSGSGEVTSPPLSVEPGIAYLASPCTSVSPGQAYTISAWTRTFGARPGELVAYWNAGLACDGPLVRMDSLAASPADDTWRQAMAVRQAPMGAQSVQLLMSAERDPVSGAPSTSRIDVVLIPEPSALALAGAALGTVVGVAALRTRRTRQRGRPRR